MSSQGRYNPIVSHPNEKFIQTTSEGYTRPFYFGASQVPIIMSMEGTGLRTTNRVIPSHRLPEHG